jgi:hypothetical protein
MRFSTSSSAPTRHGAASSFWTRGPGWFEQPAGKAVFWFAGGAARTQRRISHPLLPLEVEKGCRHDLGVDGPVKAIAGDSPTKYLSGHALKSSDIRRRTTVKLGDASTATMSLIMDLRRVSILDRWPMGQRRQCFLPHANNATASSLEVPSY